MLKRSFPFDPLLKHHIFVALTLAVWVFLFLTLTEPLDTNELKGKEKFIYLPLYGLGAASAYMLILPLQKFLYEKNKNHWMLWNELLFFILMTLFGLLLSRAIYLYVIVPGEQNPYTLYYFTTSVYLPALATILPVLAIGRWASGRYFEKKLEDQKIEIEGEGTYEGLRLQLNELVAVKADDNYVEVSFMNNGNLKKQLIRNKLSKIETSIPELMRTHRSYLINPNHFRQFKMDAGKLTLILSSEVVIPVSKTYAESIKDAFKS